MKISCFTCLALVFLLPTLAHATGLNASHFSVTDSLAGISDTKLLVNGNTRYRPDLDLSPNGAVENQLRNTSLDEVFLKITFKPGVTPDLNKLIEIRYGNAFDATDEFVFKPGNQKIYSRIVGQDLMVWYGLEDRADFGQTTVLTDSRWTFTVAGDDPVAEVFFFISHHSNVASEMPDLLPLNYNHLYLLPEPTSQLFTEATDGHVQGKPLQSAQKLIVLVHGWNPADYSNKFAPDNEDKPDDSDEKKLSPRWAQLASNLIESTVVQQFGWTVARYDWSRDANAGLTHPRNAMDAAIAHGAKLGQLVRNAGATRVQFIAHSAGNWAARRAAAYLKLKNPSIQIQITSLDPYVTDDLQPAYELTSLWTTILDNFYVVDLATDAFHWTSGDFTGWNNHNIEYLVIFGLYEPWMNDHAGPVSWYAKTAKDVNLGKSGFEAGFITSLAARLASRVNDDFPGQALAGESGSALWFNYQATAQPSEPRHDSFVPARRSVWGRWTAPASGTATFDTFGADFNAVLAAYTGGSLSSLTQIASDTRGQNGRGQCQISFPAVAGQTYYIAVDQAADIIREDGQSPLHWSMSGGGGPAPAVSITAPAAGVTINNVITVNANASSATKVEFYLDAVRQFTDSAAPFTWAWNTATAANMPHILSVKSYSGTVLLATSANVPVTVNNPSTPSPECVDPSEPNNSSPTATPLALAAAASGYICTATDVDWFKVVVSAPGVLSFDLTVPAANDYDLELFGPDAAYISGSYRDTGLAENITHNATVIGTYYVRVYGYPLGSGSYDATKPYGLMANFVTGPPVPNMAVIPAGSFQMGDSFNEGISDEVPTHSVYVSAFYMDRYEVTKALWDEVYQWAVLRGYAFDNSGGGKAANHPVVLINWFDMVKWCNARSEKENRTPAYYYSDAGLSVPYRTGRRTPYVNWSFGYRLPTEAEWEKAARGGASEHRFPWSDADTITHSWANYRSSAVSYDLSLTQIPWYHPAFDDGSFPYTNPVGYFAPNDYGLYDMAGNIAERCWDWYGAYSSDSQIDPRGPESGTYHVMRGGGWGSDPSTCRAANRSQWTLPDYPDWYYGFRTVLPVTVEPKPPLAAVNMNIEDTTVVEGNTATTQANFRVSLSAVTTVSVTVDFVTVDGSAQAGQEYELTSGTLTFAPGEVAQTISVRVKTDRAFARDRTFTVRLSNPAFASLLRNEAQATITNDDPLPQFTIAEARLLEGNSGTVSAQVVVTLAGDTREIASVSYSIASETAKAGSDVQTVTGGLTFNPGETSKTILVPVVSNLLLKLDEAFTVTLSNPVNATLARPSATVTFAGSPVPDMAFIPAGSFQIGDSFNEGISDEVPTHSVYVSAFYMDRYEVTKALWDEVYQWAVLRGYAFDNSGGGKAANHPVVLINWFDMVKWCNARSEKENRTPAYYSDAGLSVPYRTGQRTPYVNWSFGYRLPTEAEWEKAARGGASGHRFPWSDADTITYSRANYRASSAVSYNLSPIQTPWYHPAFDDGSFPYTNPVGYFAPNDYGLYDMAGNIAERCWDWYGAYSSDSQIDPRGPESGTYHVMRGGGWGGDVSLCRAANRSQWTLPDYPDWYYGFRTVLPVTVEPKPPPATVSLTIDDTTIVEGNSGTSQANFRVSLSAVATVSVTVDFVTVDGSARAGQEYELTSGKLTFAPGEVAQSISVPVKTDRVFAQDKTFSVRLSNTAFRRAWGCECGGVS